MAEYSPNSFINRETSWIEFNRRVLEEANDPDQPLLERLKFLSIFATNLDEFFMIRVSGLRDQVAGGIEDPSPDGLAPSLAIRLIGEKLQPLIEEHSNIWEHDLKQRVREHGIHVLDYSELTEPQREFTNRFFYQQIFPILTPLVFDPGHPFPHISNLSLSIAVVLEDERGHERFARVKVPPLLPRLVELEECDLNGDEETHRVCLVWVEQIIAANIGALFPEVTVKSTSFFRVTRDTDIEIQEDEASDLLATIESSVRERKWGSAVRLEISHDMHEGIREVLTKNLVLEADEVYEVKGTLNLADLMELYKLPFSKLKDAPLVPRVPYAMHTMNEGDSIFRLIRHGDQMLHHPYESFAPVVDFIRAASRDPHVLAIKITLYRVGKNSPLVQLLIDAVNNGKQVAAMVELKARFDEENNINWARALEDAGVHVVYGLPNLKVHAKVVLVVRKDDDGIRRYVHLSTGNYNVATARIYTDLGLLTCNEDIGEDATNLFNLLTGYSRQREFKKLLIAPVNLRDSLVNLIKHEIKSHKKHGNGRLIFKMNALVDPEMIALLYDASQAGVKIDLIIRGICCLRPGVEGLSENIRVISIVGRFLEHSRIYYFYNNGNEKIYLGSADLMQRNLDRRVEVIFPVLDEHLLAQVRDEILMRALADNIKARELQTDGTYTRRTISKGEERIDSQLQNLSE